ncbi:MAG: tetratricopeptide repeat protein [Lachnospiraceae bacterium]|nr:tetratricopeptide repeat protein [Lachnospiraceae bacterium]
MYQYEELEYEALITDPMIDQDDPQTLYAKARCYRDGKGIEVDMDRYRMLLEVAAESGSEIADAELRQLSEEDAVETSEIKDFVSSKDNDISEKAIDMDVQNPLSVEKKDQQKEEIEYKSAGKEYEDRLNNKQGAKLSTLIREHEKGDCYAGLELIRQCGKIGDTAKAEEFLEDLEYRLGTMEESERGFFLYRISEEIGNGDPRKIKYLEEARLCGSREAAIALLPVYLKKTDDRDCMEKAAGVLISEIRNVFGSSETIPVESYADKHAISKDDFYSCVEKIISRGSVFWGVLVLEEVIFADVTGTADRYDAYELIKEAEIGADKYLFSLHSRLVEKEKGSIIEYQQKAGQGDARAQYELGQCYTNGYGIEEDIEKAVFWYKKSAEQGYASAQYSLGDCYYYGEGVEEDEEKAVCWYRKAADQGNADAQFSLGYCYDNGIGTEIDEEKAFYWYQKAAKQGNADAQFSLGCCYDRREGIEEDREKAFYWYQKAAEQENVSAQYNLGICYAKGEGTEKDGEKAFFWFQKAAEHGDACAQTDLGVCYDNGIGTELDEEKAFYWYQKAAEQGNDRAQNSLGSCYANGDGIEKNAEKAFYWYRKAAEQGNANAQYITGFYYDYAEGTEKNVEKAVYWYRKAAKQGNIDAQYELGPGYEYGQGAEQNYQITASRFQDDAEQEDNIAQCNLGLCYELGKGVEKDYSLANYWYRKAEGKGNYRAQYRIGLMYEYGTGLNRDYSMAKLKYEQAFKNGYIYAGFRLGLLYYYGRGVEQDYYKAASIFELLKIGEAYEESRFYLAYSYAETGRFADAVRCYEKSIELNPNESMSLNNLAELMVQGKPGVPKQFDEALVLFERSAELGNDYAVENLKKYKMQEC